MQPGGPRLAPLHPPRELEGKLRLRSGTTSDMIGCWLHAAINLIWDKSEQVLKYSPKPPNRTNPPLRHCLHFLRCMFSSFAAGIHRAATV